MNEESEIPPPKLLKISEDDSVPFKMIKIRKNEKAMEEWKEKKKKQQEEHDQEQWIRKHPKWRWQILRQKLKAKMEEEEKKKKEQTERENRIRSLPNWRREQLQQEQNGC